MAIIQEIPTFPEVPRYDVRTTLGGREYLLDFDYIGREDRWYVALAMVDGTRLAGYAKIVPNVPLWRAKYYDPRMPRGILIPLTLDTRATNAAPGWADFGEGRRVRLYFRAAGT